jgi:hypothetical protein
MEEIESDFYYHVKTEMIELSSFPEVLGKSKELNVDISPPGAVPTTNPLHVPLFHSLLKLDLSSQPRKQGKC